MRSTTVPVEGADLLVRLYPVEEPLGACLIVHGFGEHSDRYHRQIEFLTSCGYVTGIYDLRGHGRSPGRTGRATVSRHVRDNLLVREVIRDFARQQYGGEADSLTTVLFGHSMGGLIAAESAVRRPWSLDGLVLSSPAFLVGGSTPAPLRVLAPLVGTVLPFIPVTTLDPNDISRDPEYVADYVGDPLVHHAAVPAGAGGTMVGDGARMLHRCRSLPMPMLVINGEDDRITAVEGARRFAAVAGTLHDPRPEVTYVEFPGARHELFNDLCRDEAYAVLGRWMRARLP